MNSDERKIYLKANELYKEGHIAEATKLWASISIIKKKPIESEPLLWQMIKMTHFLPIDFAKIAINFLMLSCSFLFGRLAFVIFELMGNLLQFKTYPDIYLFLSKISITEQNLFIGFLNGSNKFSNFFQAMEQYFVSKILHVQVFLNSGQINLNAENATGDLIFNNSFPLVILLVSIGVLVDFYFFVLILLAFYKWIIRLCSKRETQFRLILSTMILFISFGFFYVVFKSFEKENEMREVGLQSMLNSSEGNGGGSGGGGSSEKEKTEEHSDRKFLQEFSSDLTRKPLSMKERAAISKIYADYIKMLKKHGITGGQGGEISVQEIIEQIKNGKISEIEKKLQQQKAKNELERLKNEYGVADENAVKQDDKEFSEVLRKSFMDSDKKTMEEYLKTSKELEEIYGKEIKDKVFSGKNKEELLKKFAENPLNAQKEAREESNKLMDEDPNLIRPFIGTVSMDIATRINSIVNYLEGGGDIKIFNQMRMQFLKDFSDPKIRLHFAMRINFVMASWNEHQNKYFWQMNRALMMEVADMIVEAANALKVDIRRTHLGWFYLVSGYYEKAREICLQSYELQKLEGGNENEGTYVDRSNAALAALMLQQGRTAFFEYRGIYRDVLKKRGYFRNKREELFTEYIRETTAALAAPNPCKEAYLCRSMFLEDINDDLALNDLLKYLSLSPTDELLVKEAQLKAKLIKSRLEGRKTK
jgi:hypothetical protein